MEKKLEKYPATKEFKVIDTIGVPHPYCITPKHVTYAADHFCGMLGKEAIISAERTEKAKCGICRGELSYEQHETALLVEVDEGKEGFKKRLNKYLLKIKAMAEADKYAGFAFIKKGRIIK